MKQQIDVLECQSGVSKAKGKPYNIALVRIPAGSGRVGKIFSDVRIDPADDVSVELEIVPNSEMFLSPTIRSVE